MTADTEYELIIYRKGTAGTLVCSFNDGSLVINGSRNFTHNEMEVSILEFQLSNGSIDPTENLLSSSCTKWSGGFRGPIKRGDYVRYSLYPTQTGAKTQVFFGKITELKPTRDGKLSVKAEDYLKALMKEYPKIVYAGYRDSIGKPIYALTDGVAQINGVNETDGIVMPLAEVTLALGDTATLMGSASSNNGVVSIDGGMAARQGFFATGDGIIGVRAFVYAGGDDTTITCGLYADDGSGSDLGQFLGSATVSITYDVHEWKNFDLTGGSGVPVRLSNGSKYWLKFSSAYPLPNYTVMNYYTPSGVVTSFQHLAGGSWSTNANQNICLYIDQVSFAHYDPDHYVYDPAGGYLYIQVGSELPTPSQSYVTPVRGLVSYYYGTVSNQTIANALTRLNTGLEQATSSNQNATSGTFSTAGKKLLEALQELANQWMASGPWSGYQLAFAHYESNGIQYLKWGKRLTSADAPYAIFSYGEDTETDDQKRIIDWSDLELRTDLRPPRVQVIGKDAAGNPLCYTVTDRALSSSGRSFEDVMEGFANQQKIVDDNLVLLSDVQSRGDGALMAYDFNVWEGQIVVSGVYPELIDLDPTSPSFGSGKVIILNLSPLGIVSQRFKVKGVVVESNQTTITLSNADMMVQNIQKYYNAKGNRTEAFLSPVGLADNVYIPVYLDSVVNGEYYMELQDHVGTVIPGHSRVKCLKHTTTGLNLNVYHAEFEKANGFTSPNPIERFALYTTETGGMLSAVYTLYSAGPPVVDERIDKFQTMRLIVDIMTKAS